ncbi:PREDICTED: uncharacterized protein LOC104813811 isoform X2 [Tarenaya hassleriana]|uniref:uncharacterized protein LOC104813811 isoform X2 n=1 Tax=Tarenaya hassleriana TaxID=28532 RepID=UPI00053C2CE6|nr:PREDICTED: uncharacterized protein LOC104813811 isoform X2 [Tarenaya hassleriana]
MGSVCCVAARDSNLPSVPGGGSLYRNSVCSPPWSFRRDNRRRVADEIEGSSSHNSYVGSRGISMDKVLLGSERGALSEGDSPPGHLGTPASHKLAPHTELDANIIIPLPSEVSLTNHGPTEVKSLTDSPDIVSSTLRKPSLSASLLSAPVCDLSLAHSRLLPPKTTPSTRARRSPGHQLFSNDFVTGSQYASSDGGWSMNAFSELVASSQRERWSFDSEHLDSGQRKLSGYSSRFSYSPVDHQTCGACSKLLTERSYIANYELPIAAVLACGHVYHAECLETMTTETEKYDPICPICTIGEERVAKMSRKALKRQTELKAKHYKRYKNFDADSYDGECDNFVYEKTRKRDGKALKMDPSSSRRGSSKSFLKRQFGSIGSKLSKPLYKDSASKKGFWSRHRKE